MLNGSMCFHLETHIWITAFHFDPFIQDVSMIRDTSWWCSSNSHPSSHSIPCSQLWSPCLTGSTKNLAMTPWPKAASSHHRHRLTGACWSCTKRVPRNVPKVAIVEACHTRLHWIQHLILWTVGPKRCPRLDVRMDVKCKKHQGHPPLSFQQHGDKPWVCHLGCDFQIFWFCKDQRGGFETR